MATAAEAAVAAVRRLASSSLTELCRGLMKHLAAADGACSGNLIFSPLSIYSALSATAAGARGRTLMELRRVVGPRWGEEEEEGPFDEDTRCALEFARAGGATGDLRVSCVSAMCHDATWTPKLEYQSKAAAWGSYPCPIDFTKPEEATQEINSCVSDVTDHGIESILDPAEAAALLGEGTTRLLLADAIYFKGSLERSFTSCKCTASYRPFHRLDGSAVHAEFMSSDGGQFVETYDGFKVLKMVYAARDMYHSAPAKTMLALSPTMCHLPPLPLYSMYMVLPDARDGLWALHHKMASDQRFLYAHQPMRPVAAGEVRVPKLKLSFSTSVKRALHDLGIQTLFSPGAAALQDMLLPEPEPLQQQQEEEKPLYLSDVLHKAVLEMDEEFQGSPAVAQAKWDLPAPAFVADHPFAFFVVEELTGAILLAGHVLDPTTH